MFISSIFVCLAIFAVANGSHFQKRSFIEALDTRIVNGNEAAEGSVPYQVSYQKNRIGHVCGGSIISERFVLTAAHCLETLRPDDQVVVGTNNWMVGGDRYPVEKILTHEKWGSVPLQYDIGLIKVGKPIVLGPRVKLIKLNEAPIPANSVLRVTGWGYTSDQGSVPAKLQELKVKYIDFETCAKMLNGSVSADQFCSFSKRGEGVCSGDSGGPIVLNDKQVGLTSWYWSKCASGFPDGYTDVSKYIDWVKKTMAAN